MLVRTYSKNTGIAAKAIIEFLNETSSDSQWSGGSKLTDENIQLLNNKFGNSDTPTLPQQEAKALPEAKTQLEPESVLQPEPQSEQLKQLQQPQLPMTTAIQTTQSQSSQPVLSSSDLEAIKVIRETFGEQGVQVFLQKKKQEQIVNRATGDAVRQHDERKLYEDVRLRVENELQIRDLIQDQQAFNYQMTQHNQQMNQRKENNKKRDEALEAQLADLLAKQQEANSTLELLGLSLI